MIHEVYCWNWNHTKAKRKNDGKVFTYKQITNRLREVIESKSMGECEIEFRHPTMILPTCDSMTEH